MLSPQKVAYVHEYKYSKPLYNAGDTSLENSVIGESAVEELNTVWD